MNRFRSVNEFIPHALWLMQDATMNRGNCSCKYCSKMPQREVSDSLGLKIRHGSSELASIPATAPRAPRVRRDPRGSRPIAQKPFAAVRPRPIPKPARMLKGPTEYLTSERDNDMRELLITGEDGDARWCRVGELVWCQLEPPIRGRTHEEDIWFWPGVVESVTVKSEAKWRTTADGVPLPVDYETQYLYEQDDEENPSLDAGKASALDPAASEVTTPWSVHQYYVYTIKMLAITHVATISDQQVLPYLAYTPPDTLLEALEGALKSQMLALDIEVMDRDLETVYDFNPMAPEPQDGDYMAKFAQTAIPLTLAIQIGSYVARYWQPTDEWDCTFYVPSIPPSRNDMSASASTSSRIAPSIPRFSSQPAPASTSASAPPGLFSSQPQPTLHSLITQSMGEDAISGPPGMPPTELESLSLSMLGRAPSASASQPMHKVTQTRYQGMWWGAERFWADELVRLKISRRQFAPAGTEHIYPPSGPSVSSLAVAQANIAAGAQVNQDDLGAGNRCLFMRVDGLFQVDLPAADGDGTVKECRLSGTLYELADEGWEDPFAEKAEAALLSNGKGKGKARATDDDMDVDSSGSGPPDASASRSATPTQPSKPGKKRSANGQTAHPVLTTPYPLPTPPTGYKFRPILHPGHEVVMSLSLVSGRYYPKLFAHPCMVPIVDAALQVPLEERKYVWAMEGMVAGVHQSMDPTQNLAGRKTMMDLADNEARDHFKRVWEDMKTKRLHPPVAAEDGGDGMDVDA